MRNISAPVPPEGYEKKLEIDLQKNKKLAVILNVSSLTILLVLLTFGFIFLIEFNILYFNPIQFLILCISILIYTFLHEIVHGIFMWIFSGVRPHFGATLLYAYAGSESLFNKRSYIWIALAPAVILGLLLTVFMTLMPPYFCWILYIVQCMNISGSCGDFYVAYKILKMPHDVLIHDTGVSMTVYGR